MITASVVLFNTKISDLTTVLGCCRNSIIDRIYVIDNSPTTRLEHLVNEIAGAKARYIHGHGNVGYGAGNNIGIRAAIGTGARFHIVMNPDVSFRPQIIEELALYMENNPGVGQLQPKLVYPDGTTQYLCRLLPTPYDIFARRLLPPAIYKRRNMTYQMRFTGYDKIWNCPALSGCFMFLNLDILRDVGLFDERFFVYFEDNDLTRRLHRCSGTIYYPFVSVMHNYASGHRTDKRLLRESILSAVKYFNKWGWFFDRERSRINRIARQIPR